MGSTTCYDGLARFWDMNVLITEVLFTIRDNADGKWDSAAAEGYACTGCNLFRFQLPDDTD